MSIADSEQMSVGASLEIRVEDKGVLIMFFWVFWYESNSGRKCLLRNYVYRLERLKLSYLHDWLYLLKVRAFTRQFTVRFGVG
jgi:hypothetical protein